MELLMDGLKLLVIGMGWVFLFLILMIIVIDLVSKAVAPYAHVFEQVPAEKVKRTPLDTDGDPAIAAMTAAAAAAVRAHRDRDAFRG
ncbi:MAG: OadG family protein [Kiritimatiellaeota bacterium]|nr:OadG family protein [Kiritimatiellota bacterium]